MYDVRPLEGLSGCIGSPIGFDVRCNPCTSKDLSNDGEKTLHCGRFTSGHGRKSGWAFAKWMLFGGSRFLKIKVWTLVYSGEVQRGNMYNVDKRPSHSHSLFAIHHFIFVGRSHRTSIRICHFSPISRTITLTPYKRSQSQCNSD